MTGLNPAQRHLCTTLLIVSMLLLACGRGYWAVAQSVHSNAPAVLHIETDHRGYLSHHHHSDADLLEEVGGTPHQIIHIMDSIDYSVPTLLGVRKLISPRYPKLTAPPQFPPDVVPVPLYRPPKHQSLPLFS